MVEGKHLVADGQRLNGPFACWGGDQCPGNKAIPAFASHLRADGGHEALAALGVDEAVLGVLVDQAKSESFN